MKALIIIDIQKDFCSGGALAVNKGDSVVAPVNKLIGLFTEKGLPVFFTRDWHPADHSSFREFGGIWPAHCIAGTRGAEFHDELIIPHSAVIISKACTAGKDAYSGFEGTDLDAGLKNAGADELVAAGLATDYCVKNTVIDALRLGYRVTVAEDAIQAVNAEPGDGEAAVAEMVRAGALFKSSADILP